MNLTPIVLFVYNRPSHTQETIEALQKNELASDSMLFIYSDAPKTDQDQLKVQEVREYIHSVSGFKKITIIKREGNWGLANSVIDGVTNVVNQYGKIIVLEDDLVTSPYFLSFMNGGLDKYVDMDNVVQISGYAHCSIKHSPQSAFFLDFPSSWGWATWGRAWDIFSPEIKQSDIDFLGSRKERLKFNLEGHYNYYDMLILQAQGKLDSWAIRWYLSVYKQQGLTLYPANTLVNNIGMDGSGTHCKKLQLDNADAHQTNRILHFPDDISVGAERSITLRALSNTKRKWIHAVGRLARKFGW